MTRDDLIAALRALPFGERALIADAAGLTLSCCPGCGCYIGSEDCHPSWDAVEWEAHGECATPCTQDDDEDAA